MQELLKKNAVISERILQLIEYIKLSPNRFAQSLGYERSQTIYDIINGKSSPSFDFFNRFCNSEFSESINIQWLLTGKGKMVVDRKPETIGVFAPKVITMDQTGKDNIVMVPTKARAGYLSGYGDPKFLAELPSYHMPGLGPGMWRDFEVSGLSMYPTINDKDHVIGKYVESIEEIKDNRVYVIVSEEGVIVKRILNRVEADGVLICKSDNKMHHPNIVLPAEEVKEVWDAKVLITRHLEDPNALYQQVGDLEARMTLLEEALKNKVH